MYQESAPVISNREVMPGIHLLWVDSPQLAATARPGQFVMIACDSSRERLLRRPISIHKTNSHGLAFLFAKIGAGTEWLAERKPEEKIDLLGPLGNSFSLGSGKRNILLAAGGIGIAPLCYLAEEALIKGLRVKLLAGARTACQICPEQLIPEGCEVIAATEDGTAGYMGMITDLFPEHLEWADQVILCGPLPMYKAIVKQYGQTLKDKPVQVSLETRMGCGLGICYSCTIKTQQGLKQVCKDGPVFNMQDVIWSEMR